MLTFRQDIPPEDSEDDDVEDEWKPEARKPKPKEAGKASKTEDKLNGEGKVEDEVEPPSKRRRVVSSDPEDESVQDTKS